LLASYLLGRDHIQRLLDDRGPATVEFTEGDDPSSAGPPHTKKKQPGVDARFDVPPEEAIDFFKRKQTVRKREFNQLTREAQQGAFTVGGVYKKDVVRGFKTEIDAALESGATQQQTVKRFKEILGGAGHRELGEYHLETIFRTNMQTAYGTGRRRQLEDVVDMLPFWQYYTEGDDRVRPRHAALNGITLPATNTFWETHFPPWDFSCRCGVTPTDEIPDGYDAKNPSGELDDFGEPLVQLSYDDDGMPVKAEMGTTLYDLQVGKFSGIPRGATLLGAIEAGVERSKQ
jgi:SPP1 gp7 family putative phage head morphogenesis protein